MCFCVWLYSQDPASLSLLSISDLVPDLQFIFFWMSNAIEILYFIQQKSPTYMQAIELMDDKGMKWMLFYFNENDLSKRTDYVSTDVIAALSWGHQERSQCRCTIDIDRWTAFNPCQRMLAQCKMMEKWEGVCSWPPLSSQQHFKYLCIFVFLYFIFCIGSSRAVRFRIKCNI